MSATTATKVYAGVDVSKRRLEVFVTPTGERLNVPNDDSGVDEILARLDEPSPTLVVLEATGLRATRSCCSSRFGVGGCSGQPQASAGLRSCDG